MSQKIKMDDKTMVKTIFNSLLFSCLMFCQLNVNAQENTVEQVVTSNFVLPQHDDFAHLGVASCAASMCHGSVIPRTGSKVMQNEYIVWSKHDAHAQAYQTLLSPASQKIAEKLGLKNAHEAAVCLDCHADNVSSEQRGEKFLINDGIGCEACHGGAEQYIKSHTDKNISREENIINGLLPIDRPLVRAKVCLSCHLGTEEKFASHDIMGAGHPRLSFELDTFGILQPLHYVVDDDYKAQKWSGNSYVTWLYGQLAANRETLNLIEHKLKNNNALFPEIALFDCHSCHHSMADIKWNETKGQGFKPGTVRLNDGNFKMLLAIAETTSVHGVLEKYLMTLRHSLNDKKRFTESINHLNNAINVLQQQLAGQDQAQQQKHASLVLQQLLVLAIKGEFSDYIAAEQSVMAIDILLVTLAKKEALTEHVNRLYQTVENENNFNEHLFVEQIKKIQLVLGQ